MAQRIFTNQVFSNTGVIGEGFKINFYDKGTTNFRTTFSDEALTIANINPIIADENGRFIDVFVDNVKLYKSVLTNTSNVTLEELDPIDPSIASLNDFDPRPLSFWGTTAGDADNYTLAADPAITATSSKHVFLIAFHVDCNAGCDLSVDGFTTKALKKYDGTGSKVDLEAGDAQATQRYFITDDGANYVVKDPEIKEKAINNTLIIPVNAELTIASGVIIPTDSQHTVDTEADASTDDIDTIDVTNLPAGKMIILSIADSARNSVIKHGIDNIITNNQEDITLDVVSDRFIGISDGTNVIELSSSLATTNRGVAKAWVVFGSTGSILNSFNTASLVRNAQGDFTWTFTVPFANTNWALLGTGQRNNATNRIVGIAMNSSGTFNQTTSSVRFETQLSDSAAIEDPLTMWMVAFGDQT